MCFCLLVLCVFVCWCWVYMSPRAMACLPPRVQLLLWDRLKRYNCVFLKRLSAQIKQWSTYPFILCLHTRFKYTSFGAVCDVGCPQRHSRRHPRRHAGRHQPTAIPTPFDTVLDPLGGSRDQVGWVSRGRSSSSCTKYWWHFILIRRCQFS